MRSEQRVLFLVWVPRVHMKNRLVYKQDMRTKTRCVFGLLLSMSKALKPMTRPLLLFQIL